MKSSNPLKWHGGKTYLAKTIIAHMPPRCKNPNNPADDDAGWLHYVEPYAGGLAVLFANDPEGISEVVNDLDIELSNFWRVLGSPELFERFRRRAAATPVSNLLFKLSKAAEAIGFTNDGTADARSVDAAFSFFVRYRQSRQGLGKDFGTLTRNRTRRGMNEQASAWLSAVEGLPDAHERLIRVIVENGFALKLIRQQVGPAHVVLSRPAVSPLDAGHKIRLPPRNDAATTCPSARDDRTAA
ncbi:MAG: DNA adenine methylase [Pirellulales bacterium]